MDNYKVKRFFVTQCICWNCSHDIMSDTDTTEWGAHRIEITVRA